jgi:hypothetical protein
MSKDPKTENVEAKTTAPASSAPALPEPEVVDEDDEFEVSNLFHPPPLSLTFILLIKKSV